MANFIRIHNEKQGQLPLLINMDQVKEIRIKKNVIVHLCDPVPDKQEEKIWTKREPRQGTTTHYGQVLQVP